MIETVTLSVSFPLERNKTIIFVKPGVSNQMIKLRVFNKNFHVFNFEIGRERLFYARSVLSTNVT